MALDTIIVFESLRCIREEDSSSRGAEPYIWPVLVRIDDLTVNTASLVDIIAPALSNARVVIKSDMRAGQSADIPPSVGLLRARLEDNLFETRLILIIALWDEDETPEAAVRAGFQAFISELGAALGNASTLLDLQEGGADGDEARKTIQDRVEQQVKSAIANSLTGPQKAAVKAESLNLDDVIGSAFKAFPNAIPAPFALSFGKGSRNEFEIRGKIEVREVRVDRCQAQVNAVRNAQSAVDEVNRQIKKLKDDLGQAPPAEKDLIRSEIKQLREDDLPIVEAALGRALGALSICRSRVPPGFPQEAEQGTGSVDEELRAPLSKSSREVVAIAKKLEVVKKDIDNLVKGLEADDRLGNFEIQR